jgi:serine protease Do
MRKFFGYTLIFSFGFLVCLAGLRAFGGFGVSNGPRARNNALGILEKRPSGGPIPDSAIVVAASRIEPAVVNIDTLVTGRGRAYEFFNSQTGRPYAYQGKGSGVIISPDGYIVTNNHVVEGANIIKVTMPNGTQYDGRLIGSDVGADIAVVKVDASHLPSAELGDSDQLKVGEYVIAIGYPLGIGTTVTHGIVSATDRRDLEVSEGRVLKQAIQTYAPINKGNSGGALANLNGQLVGINTAIFTGGAGGGNIGIGFAIPINGARSTLKDIIAKGRDLPPQVTEPFMGIIFGGLSAEYSREMKLPEGKGAVIATVYPLTSAAAAGLAPGDVILAVDGNTIDRSTDVRSIIRRHQPGDKVNMSILRRSGNKDNVEITLGKKPEGFGK